VSYAAPLAGGYLLSEHKRAPNFAAEDALRALLGCPG
jgi:hypothetical protein